MRPTEEFDAPPPKHSTNRNYPRPASDLIGFISIHPLIYRKWSGADIQAHLQAAAAKLKGKNAHR